MDEKLKIIDTNADNIHEFGFCGYKNTRQEGYERKLEWLKERFKEGLKFKILFSDKEGAVGFIEYLPGEYAWRPVEAEGYMFIHCLMSNKKKYRDQGWGSELVKECIKDAKGEKMSGVAVTSRKGSWMVGCTLFLNNGFKIVDTAPPDFELLAYKFDEVSPSPVLIKTGKNVPEEYGKGLTIFTTDQCPYTAKALNEICWTAEKEYGLQVKLIKPTDCHEARKAPSPYGIFNMIYNGKLVADHPISNKRFQNIMNKVRG